jgi:hypothetical protein
MRFLRSILKQSSRSRAQQARLERAREIESMGMQLVDESGWIEGRYEPKRYLIHRDGEVVAGPFASSAEAVRAARSLAQGGS